MKKKRIYEYDILAYRFLKENNDYNNLLSYNLNQYVTVDLSNINHRYCSIVKKHAIKKLLDKNIEQDLNLDLIRNYNFNNINELLDYFLVSEPLPLSLSVERLAKRSFFNKIGNKKIMIISDLFTKLFIASHLVYITHFKPF